MHTYSYIFCYIYIYTKHVVDAEGLHFEGHRLEGRQEFIYIHTYNHIFGYIYICIYVYTKHVVGLGLTRHMYLSISTTIYRFMYICIYVYMYICTCIYLSGFTQYVYIYIHL